MPVFTDALTREVRLEYMRPEMIDAARQVTDACYTIYCSLPRRITIEYCQIEEMAIKVEELGLADTGARA